MMMVPEHHGMSGMGYQESCLGEGLSHHGHPSHGPHPGQGPATDGWDYGQQENFYQGALCSPLPALQGAQYPAPHATQSWYCPRRTPYTLGRFLPHASHPTSIARRNERERNRVKTINSTFAKLRNHLPSGGKNKKLSKVQILRNTITYINQLQQILDSQDAEEGGEHGAHARRIKAEPEDADSDDGKVTDGALSFLSSDSPVTSPNTMTSHDSIHSGDLTDDVTEDDDLGELSDWL